MSTPSEVLPGVYDWSTVHKPVGTQLFSYPQGAEWNDYALSEDLVNQFWRDGYISNIPILTEAQCDLLLNDYTYFTGDIIKHPGHELLYEYHSNQSGDPDNVLMHCLGHWRLTQLFHDLVFHPSVAVHIALDEQTEENGGLLYIPGSHRWNRSGQPLPVLDFNFKDMEGIKTILSKEELESFRPKPALLKKGEASFHSAMTVHGSYGNRSTNPRRAAVLNYFADGVRSDTDEGLLVKAGDERGPQHLYSAANIPKGNKMEGQFYPVVFDPAWAKC